MANDNRPLKYLRYAIGEIVLVVIGILIALWINNQNQERLKQEKFEATLVKIQNDILDDIDFSISLIGNYVLRDSIKNRIFNNQIPYDKLSLRESDGIRIVSLTRSNFSAHTGGYEQLLKDLNDVPKKYKNLIGSLNKLYIDDKVFMDDSEEKMQNILEIYKNYLAENEHWLAENRFNGQVNDAEIDFYRNNPRFKSHVYQMNQAFRVLIFGNFNYRNNLIKTYIIINEIIGDKASELPKQIRTTSVKTEQDANKLIGTYELISGPDNTRLRKKLEFRLNGKDLYFSNESVEPRRLLFYNEEKPWFGVIGRPILFRFEYQGENTLSIIDGAQSETHWVKTSD